MRRPKVDLNVSPMDFTPSPSPPSPDALPDHNLVRPTPSMPPYHQPAQEEVVVIKNHDQQKKDETMESHKLGLMLKQRQLVQSFWREQRLSIQTATSESLHNHPLPLARVRKVMKANKEVKMLSAECAIVFAKASEMFIQELTLRAWLHTDEGKRRTMQRCDIARALSLDELFDFLVHCIPHDCQQQHNREFQDQDQDQETNEDAIPMEPQVQKQRKRKP